MKCDDFLRQATTGGLVVRWLARRHRLGCPRCAATWDGLAKMQAELSRTEPLSPRERNLWASVLGTSRPRAAARPAWALPVGGFVAAAALLLAVGWFLWSRDRAPQPGDLVPQVGDRVQGFDDRIPRPEIAGSPAIQYTPAEISDIEIGLTRLAADLDRLGSLAELLEARREVRELAETYAPLATPGQSGAAPPGPRVPPRPANGPRPSSG